MFVRCIALSMLVGEVFMRVESRLTFMWRAAIVVMSITLQGCGGGSDSPRTPPSAPASPEPPPPGTNPPNPPPTQPGTPPPPPPSADATFGLDARPQNATCRAWDKPVDGDSISVQRFTQLTFPEPVNMVQAPHDNATWYVVLIQGIV